MPQDFNWGRKMAYFDLFFMSLGGALVGCGIGLGIKKFKKIRASFEKAAEEAQTPGKDGETSQPNYWVNHVDQAVLPPKECQRPDTQPIAPDSSSKAGPTS